jgi:hypothetical protein
MTGSDEPQPKRARHALTLGDKLWLLDYADNNPKVSNADFGKALARHPSHPETLTAGQVACIRDVRRLIERMQLDKKQCTISAYFSA